MARPKLGDSDSKRLQMVITEDELKAIDDWRFENRIDNRSEAIRRLCQTALNSDAYVRESLLSLKEARKSVFDLGDSIVELIKSDADVEAVLDKVFNGLGDLHGSLRTIEENLDNATVTEGVAKSPVLQHLPLEKRFEVARDLLNFKKGGKK